jgi:hypothetical protein
MAYNFWKLKVLGGGPPFQCTEVGRAFLIHFQKLVLNKVFLMIKITREL